MDLTYTPLSWVANGPDNLFNSSRGVILFDGLWLLQRAELMNRFRP